MAAETEPIRVLLAAVSEEQRDRIVEALEQANSEGPLGARTTFELEVIVGRGMEVLRWAAGADVVLFGLDDAELPGEASHVLAAFPGVKIVGVDDDGQARIVVGAVLGSLSHDLPTVIRWITSRTDAGVMRGPA